MQETGAFNPRPTKRPLSEMASSPMTDMTYSQVFSLNPRPDRISPDDLNTLRSQRLQRIQNNLKKADCGGALLYDPVNVRYATDARNMQVWTMHNPVRYVFIPAEGKPVLFDYRNSAHMSAGLPTVGEVRRATTWHYFYAVTHIEERVQEWADEICDLLSSFAGDNRRIAVDIAPPEGVLELQRRGLHLINGQEIFEMARCIKQPIELECIKLAVEVCQEAIEKVRLALEPGRTENELWSILNEHNAARGGEYIETKLLSSGSRTNPWYQECSHKVIEAGELVAFDTDMIGPYGYDADISRTLFCGPGTPSDEQRLLYRLAHEQLEHNVSLLRVGGSFREFIAKSWPVPERYRDRGLAAVLHGVGMCNEYPLVAPSGEFKKYGYDGYFEENMVVCIESYIAAADGVDGVKLENMVHITEQGPKVLSTYPYDEVLLA